MLTPRRREQIMVIGGGLLLLLFVVLSWVPSGCPVVRRALIGCPSVPLSMQTPAEQEINRVPHQTIDDSFVQVDVKAQPDRGNTRIDFEYRAPTGSDMSLSVQNGSTTVPLATIANPLLPPDATWHVFTSHRPDITLYTRDELTETTIEDFLGTHPGKLVADAAAARLYNLQANQYTPLAGLSSLDGYSALLVAYLSPQPDGTWSWFDQTVDVSAYPPDKDNHLHFAISITRPSGTPPLLLGEVHVDYRK